LPKTLCCRRHIWLNHWRLTNPAFGLSQTRDDGWPIAPAFVDGRFPWGMLNIKRLSAIPFTVLDRVTPPSLPWKDKFMCSEITSGTWQNSRRFAMWANGLLAAPYKIVETGAWKRQRNGILLLRRINNLRNINPPEGFHSTPGAISLQRNQSASTLRSFIFLPSPLTSLKRSCGLRLSLERPTPPLSSRPGLGKPHFLVPAVYETILVRFLAVRRPARPTQCKLIGRST
jgi:hypothetical protein